MNELMAAASRGIEAAADALFMPWIVVLLFGAGLFLTVRYRFVQFRRFPDALRAAMGRESSATRGALTPFQAFMTALAASIGTGNVAGVATAIISGGPGALFWIWCYGLVAMAIKLTEAILGRQFRVSNAEGISTGPMYYLRDGLGSPALAWIYAFVAGVAALTTTPFTQPNSIADVLRKQVGVPTLVSGIVLAVLTWLVIIGGLKSIGRVVERLSPLKVGLYLIGGLVVIVSYGSRLPEVLTLVVTEAFSTRAVAGGSGGVAMLVALRYGLARGIYANEAGYGTAAVAYGTAGSREPVQQGLHAVLEVFIVSFVTSTISALALLLTGAWQGTERGAGAVVVAFEAAMPGVGGWVVTFCVFLFGYTTLIGWAYYGEQFLEYLLGRRVTVPYRWIYCLLIPFGAVSKVDVVWAWGDLMNALQVFPNMVGLVGLSGLVAALLAGRTAPADPRAPRE
ncbi:MAG: amino acid carrier protein [Vicinamibacteraceae bacterium]